MGFACRIFLTNRPTTINVIANDGIITLQPNLYLRSGVYYFGSNYLTLI